MFSSQPFQKNALHSPRKSTKAFISFLAILVYSSLGFYYFEKPVQPDIEFQDSMWWALVTMTTVGYGDVAPVTFGGRFFIGFPTLILGVALIGYTLSLFATFLFESQMTLRKGRMLMKLDDHVLIIRFSSEANVARLVHELQKDHPPESLSIVVIDDKLEELPVELSSLGLYFVKGNPERLATLERANFRRAKSAIVLADLGDSIHSDLKNLAVLVTLEKEAPHIKTIVECVNPEYVPLLERAGCHSVVCLSSMTSQMIVQELLDPGSFEVIRELTSNSRGKQFYVVPIPSHFKLYGELQTAIGEQDVVLTGIRRGEQNYFLRDPKFLIQAGDRAVFIATERPHLDAAVGA